MNRKEGGPSRILAYALAAAMGFVVPWSVCGVSSALAQLPPAPAGVEVTTSCGMEFSTISAPNYPAYTGPLGALSASYPRGSVGYEFRMARTEVSTGLWMEFANTFINRTPRGINFATPFTWGATVDPDRPDYWMLDPRVPNAANVPVTGIGWRDAARFCNWLHNDKSSDLSAIASGVYNESTFGPGLPDGSGGFTDQTTRSANAKFWIPTLDEWVKASYFDPNRHGENQPGYWRYPTRSDTAPVGGFPGQGQTNAGFIGGGFERLIPVGSYSDVQSPWGLLDASGSAAEWTSTAFPLTNWRTGLPTDIFYCGSQMSIGEGDFQPSIFDFIDEPSSSLPFDFGQPGLRIAAAIPSPSSAIVVGGLVALIGPRTRRSR
ncbi:MAG: SUMF1/EgtB/PvdO family nonheme iron enzyme [Phycisphaerales bacterium]